MDVSIVIVNWNTRDILRDCLLSVYEQTKTVNFEVLVVDNASGDGSPEMVAEEFPQVILLANAENVGFAAANNQGIAVSKGRYVLLLNSDTVVLDGAIDKVVTFADGHPEAGVVGCRVLNPDRTLQPSCFMYPSIVNSLLESLYLNKLFPRNRFFGRALMGWWDRDDVRDVEVVTGCFMFVRREAIEDVGVMDDRYFMYAEETDWCYRFSKAGWRNLFTPAAEIVHLGGQSTAQRRGEMIVQLRLGVLIFVRKCQGLLPWFLVSLNTILFFAIRAPVWLLLGLILPGKRRQAWVRAVAYLQGIGAVICCRRVFKGAGQ